MKNSIAFIVPHLSGGGAERVVANLSKGISNEYDKYLIIYHDTEVKYEHDGKVINLNIGPSNDMFGKIMNTIYRIRKIRKIKKKYGITKTISFLDNPNIVNVFSRVGDKVFVSIRNHQSKELVGIEGLVHQLVVKYFYTKSNKIVAISQGVRKDLIENFGVNPNKVSVIYNPVDIDRIKILREESIEKEYQNFYNNPTIITVGRLAYQKGQWHLIRAFREVVNKVPNANLIILGSGELKEQLVSLIDEMNLTENVHIIGFQQNPFKFISRADIFVLPSLFEGLGNVLLEAMACETPIISTDCESGPREIIAPLSKEESRLTKITIEDFGILIPVLSGGVLDSKPNITPEEKMLSESMLLLLNDEELREQLKINGITRVNEFSLDNISKKWLNL